MYNIRRIIKISFFNTLFILWYCAFGVYNDKGGVGLIENKKMLVFWLDN